MPNEINNLVNAHRLALYKSVTPMDTDLSAGLRTHTHSYRE